MPKTVITMVPKKKQLYVFMIGLGGLDFGHVDSLGTIVYQMKGSQITRGWGGRRKTTRETIKKYLELMCWLEMVYDRKLWCRLIHMVDLMYLDKVWLLLCVYPIRVIQLVNNT